MDTCDPRPGTNEIGRPSGRRRIRRQRLRPRTCRGETFRARHRSPRPHAGNTYDELDAHGILIHRYSAHLLHTQSKQIFRLSFPLH